jgi:hypothetical protein
MARHVRAFLGIVIAGLALGACATSGKDDGMSRAVSKTAAGLPGAAMTPLTDLNITRTEIPRQLAVLRSAYETLPIANCRTIATEVVELTNILGPDIDAPLAPGETLDQRLGDTAANWIIGTVTSTMSDFIPFRSAVRMATGATAHEKRLRAAYERGMSRRAYLKGVGASLGCAPPAAPQPGAGFTYTPPVPPKAEPAQPARSSSGRPG